MSTTTLETEWRVLFYVGEYLNFEKKFVSRKTNYLKLKIIDHFGRKVQEKSGISWNMSNCMFRELGAMLETSPGVQIYGNRLVGVHKTQ